VEKVIGVLTELKTVPPENLRLVRVLRTRDPFGVDDESSGLSLLWQQVFNLLIRQDALLWQQVFNLLIPTR